MKKNWTSLLILILSASFAEEPNPPSWPETVTVCDPSDQTSTQDALNQIYKTNGGSGFHGQFTGISHAFLFKPGKHDKIEAKVGYYTSIIGLGSTPGDTTIQNVHQSDYAVLDGHNQVTQIFWRSCENFTQGQSEMVWATSQACPLRRVNAHSLTLSIANSWSSGGFFSGCTFGSVDMSTQQQWFARNSYIGSVSGNPTNLVFVGCTGSLPSGSTSKIIEGKTPVIVEKPFITIDSSGKYQLQIPQLLTNKSGVNSDAQNKPCDFDKVHVATPSDSSEEINAKIAAGTHIIFTPGNYVIEEPIVVNHPDIVLLGIGFPCLQAANSAQCIQVGDVPGVRVAGILFDASVVPSQNLLVWGSKPGAYPGDATNPGLIADCFFRVGGPNNSVTSPVASNTMVRINAGNVIIDNLWAWRADHDIQGLVYKLRNPCTYGLVVDGNDVTSYGLAVEHTLGDLTVWNGDNGRVYFYQSELPYDVTPAYGSGGSDYVSYRVGPDVQSHDAYGVGAYSIFRDYPVILSNGFAIEATGTHHINFTNAFTWFISGHGQISHVIQGEGGTVAAPNEKEYVGSYTSSIGESSESCCWYCPFR